MAYADRLQAIFGDRLYVEISRRFDPVEGKAEAELLELAYARDLPIVATNPCCFAEQDFGEAHDAMLCIASSSYIASEDRPRSSPDAWMKPAKDMRTLFADLPEAIANTLVVAQRCAVAAPKRKPILPSLAGDPRRRGGSAAGGGRARGWRSGSTASSNSAARAKADWRDGHIATGSNSSSTSSSRWGSPAIS